MKTSFSLISYRVHIRRLEVRRVDNVESSFKVVLVDLKTTGTDNLQGPLSASYVPSSCIKLILFDHEAWKLQPLLFLPRREKTNRKKILLIGLKVWQG